MCCKCVKFNQLHIEEVMVIHGLSDAVDHKDDDDDLLLLDSETSGEVKASMRRVWIFQAAGFTRVDSSQQRVLRIVIIIRHHFCFNRYAVSTMIITSRDVVTLMMGLDLSRTTVEEEKAPTSKSKNGGKCRNLV